MVLRLRSVDRKYQIRRRISTGVYGEVYEAEAADVSRPIVIKRLLAPVGEDLRALFLRETSILASMDHPNIIDVIDVGEVGEDYVFVLERVEGPTLTELIEHFRQAGDPASVELACGLVAQIARGVGHAHERARPDGTPLMIVHRDLNPDVVTIRTDGVPKIIDFGLSTLAGADITEPGRLRGLSPYMAPERVRCEKIDARADIFSLGAILFELISGQPLIPIEGEVPLRDRLAQADFEPVLGRLGGTDQELVFIIDEATQKDPESRLKTARDLEKRLDRFRAVREMRMDQSRMAQLIQDVWGEIAAKRPPARAGALENREIVLLRDAAEVPQPRKSSVPPRQPSEPALAGPRRKDRLERLERVKRPDIARPASLPKPKDTYGETHNKSPFGFYLFVAGMIAVAIAYYYTANY